MSFTKIKNLYIVINHVVAELGKDGEIQRRHELVENLMMALYAIDHGEFKPDLFDRAQTKLEASATRIAELEQQLADAKQAARWESDLASQALDHMKLMENALQYCPFCGNEIIDPAIQGERHDG